MIRGRHPPTRRGGRGDGGVNQFGGGQEPHPPVLDVTERLRPGSGLGVGDGAAGCIVTVGCGRVCIVNLRGTITGVPGGGSSDVVAMGDNVFRAGWTVNRYPLYS
jgi:hypothetical protein